MYPRLYSTAFDQAGFVRTLVENPIEELGAEECLLPRIPAISELSAR